MPGLLPHVDPDGLLEFSVVYTDRALNHMSKRFTGVMQDILATLKEVYHARTAVLVPGSGTFGMEAVARQFANREKVLIIRNGWFSYRWSQIFDAGGFGLPPGPGDAQPAPQGGQGSLGRPGASLGGGAIVCQARQQGEGSQAPWAPCPAEEIAATIRAEKPKVIFAPHVETASGILLPDDYLRTVSAAAREVGALFVLDCVASGAVWVDMQATGVDVLISAPQKGWSGSPCCAMVMLGERAREAIEGTTSSSFSCDLKKWMQIAEGYERGQHAYHTTMPTDALVLLRDVMKETRDWGFEAARQAQFELGDKVRALLESRGLPSVAAEGFKAPGVVVSYTTDPGIQSAKKFIEAGLQTASGVPLQCGEGPDFMTFRIGLFGLEKWRNVDRSVGHLKAGLDKVLGTA
ncbi:aspartate aminotransferase-like enzyme [Pseudacidovorax sp. 1753]|uniref:aminotransferase class V-fold PLP-dependent enzyme n=1 Tax=Pseudacidovorax sp. 1753 TaxID=3156419 RepID=UPI0033959152